MARSTSASPRPAAGRGPGASTDRADHRHRRAGAVRRPRRMGPGQPGLDRPARFRRHRYQTFGAKPDWGDLDHRQAAPRPGMPLDTHIAVDNFVSHLDLHAAGTSALDVMLVSAKRGAVTLGDGNDHVTWVAHSNARRRRQHHDHQDRRRRRRGHADRRRPLAARRLRPHRQWQPLQRELRRPRLHRRRHLRRGQDTVPR